MTKAMVGIAVAVSLGAAALFLPAVLSPKAPTEVATLAAPPVPIATTAPVVASEPADPAATEAPSAPPIRLEAVPNEAAQAVEPAGAAPAVLPTRVATAEPTPEAPTRPPLVSGSQRQADDTKQLDATDDGQGGAEVGSAADAPEPTPTTEPEPTPTTEPEAEPTATPAPAPEPTATPTPEPTVEPTPLPTAEPTAEPTPFDLGPDDSAAVIGSSGWMYIDSNDGLFLRSEPAGSIVHVLGDGVQVFLTGSFVNANGRLWAELDQPASGWVALSFLSTDPPETPAPAPTVGASGPSDPPTAADWAAMRECESDGRYDAVHPSGLYHGAYQFLVSTWDGLARQFYPHLVGVLPSEASPSDQDLLAAKLFELEGARPWPTCGLYLL